MGPHALIDGMKVEAPAIGYDYTSPARFVELCERVRGRGTEEELAKQVQHLEWHILFDWCFQLSGR